MGIYKTRTLSLQETPASVKKKIQQIHHLFNQGRTRTHIDWITWDRFRLETNAFSPLVAYKGRIQNIDHKRVYLHIQPKLYKWKLFFHLSILVPTGIGLLFITGLMFEIHPIRTIVLALFNVLMIYGLYKNLIGRPRKQITQIINQLSKPIDDYKPRDLA